MRCGRSWGSIELYNVVVPAKAGIQCLAPNVAGSPLLRGRQSSIYDAKARFSELIERAQSGRSTVVTKRGRVAAKIAPARERVWDRSAVLDEVEALRKRLAVMRRFRIADLLADGRL